MNKNILVLCGLIILSLLATGCSERDDVLAPIIEGPSELNVQFGMTITDDYVPFLSATIPMVTGGSDEYSYELYRHGELVGNDPIEVLRFDEARVELIMLKVIDMVTGEVDSATVAVAGQSAPPGLPLETTLYIPDSWGYSPLTFSALGIARGGTPPYSYEISVDGEVVVLNDVLLAYQLYELGNHEVIFRATDANGNTQQSFGSVLITEQPTDPLMHVNLIALPQTVELGKQIGLVTVLHGGQAPFEFRITVDGQMVATQPTCMYEMNTLGELIAMVEVTDATGVSESIGLSIFGVEPEIHEHPVTVDVSAGSYEEQLGEPIAFHADVDGDDYDSIEWHYILNENVTFGTGEDVSYALPELGIYDVMAIVLKDGSPVAADAIRVLITPADQLEPLVIDNVSASPPAAPVGTVSVLDVDLSQFGEGVLDYVWRTNDGNIVGTTESINYTFHRVGPDTVTVWVTDEAYQHDHMSVILEGEPDDETVTYSFQEEIGIWVGPTQTTDSTTFGYVPPEAMMHFYVIATLNFDVRLEDQAPVVIELRYSDDSVLYATVDDLNSERPSEVRVHLGEIPIEEGMEVKLHYTGNIYPGKCNGRDELVRLEGETSTEESANCDKRVVCTSQRPLNITD
ncbi:MAG: hypothetical protein HOE19_02260 [Candidatus Komeilibacteria bacterium]|nr:hypothetical protein [Candidatus Komeilibacteria bacterium]MBT4447184.1 hypothetical protein [Candidatus Komeilibacteria bacterium]MBT7188384.1 hypothetical protein [Candidatus Bathyarchaeota archaeon]